jgi:inner membrane protein
VAFQATLKGEAERFAAAYAAAQRLTDARIVAHPRPVSPFNWTVYVTHGDDIAYSHVNLRRTQAKPPADPGTGFIARLDAAYRPLREAQWTQRTRFGMTSEQQALARSAWNSPALGFFRWFADLPAFDGVASGSECVAFRDLRFDTPGRDAIPFRFTVCRASADDRWRLASAEGGVARR